ncbi:MAG TPA: GntR family transcriptional regulator [Aliicoccus persicus]|uniref:GntR family transcriptional regulator n=1 Tax=Aliicoccus persicus TaxID=930138 RepID=A0A921DY68_9STAP|nr:GntR family transcriptional regulator [Aliicoccus persicus]
MKDINNKIEYLTLTENVTSIIKNKIINGELSPGDRIIESELANELKISRGPIREALRKVEHEGLVDYQSNKGCMVRVITEKEVRDVYMIRAYLEILSVDLCKGKFQNKTISLMENLINEMKEASDDKNVARLVELDEDFHSLIVKESNNHKLFEIWSGLKSINIVIISSVYNLQLANLEKQGEKHQLLVDKLKIGEAKEINNIIKSHYDNSANHFNNMEDI